MTPTSIFSAARAMTCRCGHCLAGRAHGARKSGGSCETGGSCGASKTTSQARCCAGKARCRAGKARGARSGRKAGSACRGNARPGKTRRCETCGSHGSQARGSCCRQACRCAAKPPAAAKPAPTPAAVKPVADDEPKLLGEYGEWRAFTASPNGKKLCFALARPGSSQTDPPNRPRDPAYLFISTRPADKVKDEISLIIGYPIKPNTEVTAAVGPATFALSTQEDGAWVKNAPDEAKMVDAMRKGSDVVIKGESGKGTKTTDTFSLKGIIQALDRVGRECK